MSKVPESVRPSSTVGCKLLIQKKKKLPLQMAHLNEIKRLQRLVSNSGVRKELAALAAFAGERHRLFGFTAPASG